MRRGKTTFFFRGIHFLLALFFFLLPAAKLNLRFPVPGRVIIRWIVNRATLKNITFLNVRKRRKGRMDLFRKTGRRNVRQERRRKEKRKSATKQKLNANGIYSAKNRKRKKMFPIRKAGIPIAMKRSSGRRKINASGIRKMDCGPMVIPDNYTRVRMIAKRFFSFINGFSISS
jgi:hypothetical protein